MVPKSRQWRAQRIPQLLRHAEGLLHLSPTLYVGAYVPGGIELFQLFQITGSRIHILEIHPPYVEDLEKADLVQVDRVVCGDVAHVRTLFTRGEFSSAVWWHGPEHVAGEDLQGILQDLEYVTRHLVVLGTPFGDFPQDELDGNYHQKHLNAIYPMDLQKYGYHTETIGEPDVVGSHILAWRWLNP
jgi:hypothetical protein